MHSTNHDVTNAALAELLLQSVLAANRSTRATRAIASYLYFSTFTFLIAALPLGVAFATFQNVGTAGTGVFFTLIAAIIFLAGFIRSLVALYTEYNGSQVPDDEQYRKALSKLTLRPSGTTEQGGPNMPDGDSTRKDSNQSTVTRAASEPPDEPGPRSQVANPAFGV